MLNDIQSFVVGVLVDGTLRGTGYVAADRLVVTCAHVLTDAPSPPGTGISVLFHSDGTEVPAEVLPDRWSPSGKDDIAVLTLRFKPGESLPTTVAVAPLGRSAGRKNRECEVFGYPKVANLNGLGGRAKVIESVCELEGRKLLQLESAQATCGYSGSPLLDPQTGEVIGTVVEIADQARSRYAKDLHARLDNLAFATPMEVITGLVPELRFAFQMDAMADRQGLARVKRAEELQTWEQDLITARLSGDARREVELEEARHRRETDRIHGETEIAQAERRQRIAMTDLEVNHSRLEALKARDRWEADSQLDRLEKLRSLTNTDDWVDSERAQQLQGPLQEQTFSEGEQQSDRLQENRGLSAVESMSKSGNAPVTDDAENNQASRKELAEPDNDSKLAAVADAKESRQHLMDAHQILPKPMLHVNLGHEFAPGDAAHVEFRLLCPGYKTTPVLRTRLSATLDADIWDPSPAAAYEGPGHWSFTESFLLTRGGCPCPPGRYEIRIELEFLSAPSSGLGKFLWARLPFRVAGIKGASDRQLEIDLEELAILDASAIDFSSFGKVTMRGRGRAIARLEGVPFATPPTSHSYSPPDDRCFQIPLQPNLDRAAEFPRVSTVIQRGTARQKIKLALPDGRRIIVMAQDSLTFGRDRFKDNDILLRWIPVNAQNKPLTEEISASHFQIRLHANGLQIEDLGSRNGTIVNGEVLPPKRPKLIVTADADAEITIAAAFRIRMQMYQAQMDEDCHTRPPDTSHCSGLGYTTVPPLWSRAAQARLEALRLERRSNLAHEEYVLLFHQVLLGPGRGCPVRLPVDDGIASVARLFHVGGHFWLERLTDRLPITIDDHELGHRELAPLAVPQSISLGSTRVEVCEPDQDLSREE